jgi:PPK2 family polyphosphate:nucleotide phosphotransferase
MNPLGLSIVAFGPPTEEELAHDFLWRIQRAVPEPGYVGVFNRSHYEDVLVARVRSLVPKRVWQARYEKINEFEASLIDDGVTLIKVMLHISYDEQHQRLMDRLDDPTKHWKFNPGDVDERAHWAEYQTAYAEALRRCGTDHAPWYVVPADRKWYRNWAVANLVLAALQGLDLAYPSVPFDIDEQRARLAETQRSENGR